MKFDNSKILLGILICLIMIALKPTPDYPIHHQPDFNDGDTVVSIGENRIAIVSTHHTSGTHGEVLVMELNESSGEFEIIGKGNYLDDFYGQ